MGAAQARAWRAQYAAALKRLSETPLIYRERTEVRAGVRAAPIGQHHLWYEVNATGVRVRRVLAQTREVTAAMLDDLPRH